MHCIVCCLCVQEEKFLKYVDSLKHMLQRFDTVLEQLDEAEVGVTRNVCPCKSFRCVNQISA